MRLQFVLLGAAAAGTIGGAWLIGLWAVGVAVIACSLGLACLALFYDDGRPPPKVPEQPNAEILERWRRSA